MALQRVRDPRAIETLEKAVQMQPDLYAAQQALGRELLRLERYADAVAPLQRAVATKPDFARAHSALGIALACSGRAAEAAAPLQRSVELDPTIAEQHRRFASQFARNPANREVVIALCGAAGDDPQVALMLADALFAGGDVDGARQAVERAAKKATTPEVVEAVAERRQRFGGR
jgi:Flp pilus assembly protein TadD